MAIFTTKSDVEQAGEGEEEQDNVPASVRDGSSLKADHGNPSAKSSNQQSYLDVLVPLQSAFARPSATFSERSTYSADNENERRTGRLLTLSSSGRLLSRSPAPSPRTWKEAFRLFWAKNKGLSLVIFAQLFGVMMNVTNKLLETSGTSGPGMHPFQVLQAVPPRSPSDMLGATLTLIDPICSHGRDHHCQRHLSVVGQSRRSTLWFEGTPWTLVGTWGRWICCR